MDYVLEVSFDDTDVDLQEAIEGRLFLTDCLGSVLTPGSIEAYFASPHARRRAAEMLETVAGVTLAESDRRRIDWLEHYRQSLEPILVGNRFVIAPEASLIAAPGRLALIIPQEQAFGTGSHETTALCIELLERLSVTGARGLDVGSGSGILALAMIRLGAGKAIAFDNDLDAYAALRENRSRNAVEPAAMPLFIGGPDAIRGGRFDVITMNILPDVILALLGDVLPRLEQGGTMVVSGIVTERRDEIIEKIERRGLTLLEGRSRGEWWAGAFYARDSIGT